MSIDEDRLPSRPLRNWFLAWHIHTGDSPEVIAKGFGLDEDMVIELLSREVPLMLSRDGAIDICRQIRVDPSAVWTTVGTSELRWKAEPFIAMKPLMDALVGFR